MVFVLGISAHPLTAVEGVCSKSSSSALGSGAGAAPKEARADLSLLPSALNDLRKVVSSFLVC